MSFQLSGRIYKIGEFRRVTDSFAVQDFRIETEDQYPQKIQLQAVNDRSDLLKDLKIGDLVTVHFDIRGRDWAKGDKEGNATNLNVWKIEKAGGEQPAQQPQQAAPAAPPANDTAADLFDDDDSLQF